MQIKKQEFLRLFPTPFISHACFRVLLFVHDSGLKLCASWSRQTHFLICVFFFLFVSSPLLILSRIVCIPHTTLRARRRSSCYYSYLVLKKICPHVGPAVFFFFFFFFFFLHRFFLFLCFLFFSFLQKPFGLRTVFFIMSKCYLFFPVLLSVYYRLRNKI